MIRAGGYLGNNMILVRNQLLQQMIFIFTKQDIPVSSLYVIAFDDSGNGFCLGNIYIAAEQ